MTPEQFIARADDVTFGILHSRFHEIWSLRLGTSLEDRPRYTPTTTFETFPFPAGMTPRDTAQRAGRGAPPCMAESIPAANIAAAARRLNELREAELKKRTLSNLYNARPAWLANAHQALDAAVAAAYGWDDYTPEMPDEEILRRLLALNLERTTAERHD